MDKQELVAKLENFKQTCQQQGYIIGDLYLDEAYPGDSSTSYVVKMVVDKTWMDTQSSSGKALHRLLEVLFESTDAKTREKVFTLCIYNEDERHLMTLPSYREVA